MSLLEEEITRKKRIDKRVMELEFKAGNSKKYKVGAIWDSVVYTNNAEGYLPGLYYLIIWKKYFKKNT